MIFQNDNFVDQVRGDNLVIGHVLGFAIVSTEDDKLLYASADEQSAPVGTYLENEDLRSILFLPTDVQNLIRKEFD
jgi:hypothetical protein